ncbi:hypothetical protein SHKM778_02150 [Streptomyces sp. KM77-8]|uniref:Uncharacterized protein n=1 Tax=Streptomyces haneummycinicus TaxID=3074435 RepID=A0AAT9H8W5_9ACTN
MERYGVHRRGRLRHARRDRGNGRRGHPVPDGTPAAPPPTSRPTEEGREEPVRRDLTATVARATLGPGTGQQVTGAGFEPGEIVLVSVDQDTRYQVVADEQGGVVQDFPLYDGAFEGVHTVELYTVSGGRRAVAEFGVRAP